MSLIDFNYSMNFFKRKNKFKNIVKKRKKYFLLSSAFFVLLLISLSIYINPNIFGLFAKKAIGSDIDNLSGFAKVLDDGTWISFNCISDPYIGGQNIFTFTFPLQFSFPSCEELDYGVNIEEDGSLSGFALSDKYGSIDFAPDGYRQKPQYSSSTGLITGFAKIESLGEDGWLRLHEEVGQTYDAVSVDNYSGDLLGYAYNETIGWVSFNCADETICGSSDYKVNYYRELKAGGLSAPNWSIAQVCETRINAKAILRWGFSGDPQTAYQIIIDDDPFIDDDEVVYDSGKIISENTQFSCPGSQNCKLKIGTLTKHYNVRFYWWLKLWDTHDKETEWVQFNTNLGHTLTDNIVDNSLNNPYANLSFTTFKHPAPSAYFTWDLEEINAGDEVYFESDSFYHAYTSQHDYNNPPIPCKTNPGQCQYSWSVEGEANISDPNNSTTTITFTTFNTSDKVHLQVSDVDSYSCGTSSNLLDINLDLPDWKESFGY